MTTAYGPLSLLAASILPVVGATSIHSTRHGAVSVGILVLAALAVVRDWGTTLRRLSFGLVAAVMLAVSTWLYGGHDLDVAIGTALRVTYLVLPAAVLSPFIDPSRLGDHLGQRLRLPPRPVVAATVALERIESVGRQWEQIARARRARGVGPDGNLLRRTRVAMAMAFSLLLSTMRTTGGMALAMDARGFAAARRRTWAEPAPWHLADSGILAAGLVMAALPWMLLQMTPAGVITVG